VVGLHRAFFKSSAFWLICIVLGGCALPQPEREKQNFIPQEELTTVSLVREGIYYFGKSRFVDAEFKFRQALYLFPEADNIRMNLAVTLKNQGQFDKSEEIYVTLLEDDPDDIKVLSGLAHLYYASGNFDEAERYFLRSFYLAAERKNLEAASRFLRSLAVLKFKLGFEERALCYSEEAMMLKKDPTEVLRHAKLLVAASYFVDAEKLIRNYVGEATSKSNSKIIHELAMASFGLEKFKETVELENLLDGRAGAATGVESEVLLVKLLAIGFLEELGQEVPGVEKTDPDSEEEEEEEEEDQLEGAF